MALGPESLYESLVSEFEVLIDQDIIDKNLPHGLIDISKDLYSKAAPAMVWRVVEKSLINRYIFSGWSGGAFILQHHSGGCSSDPSHYKLVWELHNVTSQEPSKKSIPNACSGGSRTRC